MILRLLRIGAIGLGFAGIFALSRQATLARGGEDVPGISWTLGLLSVIFGAGAMATERTRGPEANLQKDMLWGFTAGGIIAILTRC